ncbi:hypothetical protein E8E12_003426 [Didymella heteroderae]|uniref:GST N-terminal domain-containing protein n=1 Tax=Didymella heteroderae TaxID=1769908 RepID=A0A9P5BXH0_9PLEO|nr:hypothetical protein E8E12_003426 [Didymella heteroderae]
MSLSSTGTMAVLWIWPSGLFPRRLLYYFRLKHITLCTLSAHNVQLIPVALSTCPPALESLPGYEARLKDASLPLLRITHADGKEVWIRESLSILEYFEELFPASDGWSDLRGNTLEERAHTRDVLSLLNDAMHWSLVHLINSDPKTLLFSGLSKEGMTQAAAEHAKGKWHFYLERLEKWLQDDGGKITEGTIAGVVLLAQVEYHQMMFGADWVEGHAMLREWVEKMKGEEWYVKSVVLKGVEDGNGWETILGK